MSGTLKQQAVVDYEKALKKATEQLQPLFDKLQADRNYWAQKGALTSGENGQIDNLLKDWKDTRAWVYDASKHPNGYDKIDIVTFQELQKQYLNQINQIYKLHGNRVNTLPSGGALLPNGTRIGGGVHTGPGGIGGVGGIGGAPSLPGYGGGLLGSLGGNRSGRGPGGSQFMPGLGFFPGAGPGPGGVGHGVGGIGLGDNDAPGPWNGNGLGSIGKHPGGGTGRQPGTGGGTKKGVGSGYSETGSKGGGDRVTGSDVSRDNGTDVGGSGGTPSEKSPSENENLSMKGMSEDNNPTEKPDGDWVKTYNKDGVIRYKWVPTGGGGGRPSDDGGGGGSDEGPPIHKGGPYFTPHGGSTGGVGVMVAGGFGVRVPGSPVSYLDFLHKNVGPEGDGWGGNNPVVTPAIKPSDLFKPADDSIGPYNPKGTDYRPAPDDPMPGGPAGAAGLTARRAR